MQSWQTCALSGELIETPVISKVSGHIFEKRLIEKHIESTGTCPITGRPLNHEDLIDVKVSKVQKPRPVTATSIPSLLSLLQNEWDALLLEQFQLKQHLEQVRHELTHALYQHDAACRVISKVIKERDQARLELTQLQQNMGARIEEESERKTDKLPQSIVSEIEQMALKLSNQRKAQRKQPNYFDQFPTSEIISNYEIKNQVTNEQPISCVDINNEFQHLILLGGSNGQITLYDSKNKQELFVSTKQTQRISSVKFIYIDESIRFVSTSEDGSVFINQYNGEITNELFYFNLNHPIVGAIIHPIQYLLIIATSNGVLSFYDARNGQLISSINDFEDQVKFTSIAIHPDGHFIALGQEDSIIKIWSMAGQKLLAQLEGQEGSITNLVFSESGLQLASTSNSEVVLWNLRNSEIIKKLFQGQQIGGIAYDNSAQYLAVGLNKCIQLIDLKKLEPFCKIESHRDMVSAISFGTNQLVTCSSDKLLNIYSS